MTPYIESGNVEEGQEKALVLGLLDGLSYEEQPESYSGFLTVDKNYDSNMFFWFIPATVSTYLLDVLCHQQIKLFQVISTSEFHEY